MQEKIEQDIKSALLGGNKPRVELLRNLKSAFLYEAVALGVKDSGLNDEQMQKVLQREAKKRQEAADLYEKGGNSEKAAQELSEKKILEEYLPEQMDELELSTIVSEEVGKISNPTIKDMGQIIGAVRARTQGKADGAAIAKLVKESLDK